jgi:hypothetical protein
MQSIEDPDLVEFDRRMSFLEEDVPVMGYLLP